MGSAAGAGQSLHDDMSSGYFRRLYLSPVRRWTFVAAPITADAAATGIGTMGMIVAPMVFFMLGLGLTSVAAVAALAFAVSGTRRILV